MDEIERLDIITSLQLIANEIEIIMYRMRKDYKNDSNGGQILE
jgi:hypothetical protein